MRRAAFAVERSANAKLGNASTTYASVRSTCPASCALRDAGCYVQDGPVSWAIRQLSPDALPIDAAREEAAAIDDLSGRRPLRLHTSGDCATPGAARAVSDAAQRYRARHGSPVWTYTHAWRDVPRNAWGAVSVLASCETPGDATQATRAGYAVAMACETADDGLERAREADLRGVPCPAQTHGRTCDTCRLCCRDDALRAAHVAVLFVAHGVRAGAASRTIKARNNQGD